MSGAENTLMAAVNRGGYVVPHLLVPRRSPGHLSVMWEHSGGDDIRIRPGVTAWWSSYTLPPSLVERSIARCFCPVRPLKSRQEPHSSFIDTPRTRISRRVPT